MDIFEKLNRLINESTEDIKDDELEFDPGFSTRKEGEMTAAGQILGKLGIFGGDGKIGMGGMGESAPSEMEEDDNPFRKTKSGEGEGGVDKTFKSTKFDDDFEDDDDDDDDDSKPGADGVSTSTESEIPEEDFEFDDFDYDDKPSGGGDGSDDAMEGGGSGVESESDEDGDFDDEDLGDEDDYDFGDGGDYGEGDYGEGDFDEDDYLDDRDDDGDLKISKKSTPKPKKGSSKSPESRGGGSKESDSRDGGSSGSSSEGYDDIDYDDTLDYDSKNFDSLESEIEDALERTKDGTSSKNEKDKLDKMKKDFSGESGDGEKSDSERAKDLDSEIKDATSDDKTGSGELAGESLDRTPSDKDFEEDMSKVFDKKDIDAMKRSKEIDMSDKIDDEKVAKEAVEEMDKKAKERGEGSSSLSKSILSTILKAKITNMEWKEMLKVFLKSKSKSSGGTFAKSRSTSWGDKKHLWRDSIMPKSTTSGGDLDDINCFIDFSGSVSQPLVFSFLQRVIELCKKLTFRNVNVYGFGERLSEPFTFKKKDIPKDAEKVSEYLKEMWDFINKQRVGAGIENFEDVGKEIINLKKKNRDTPILIFGDGLWAMSYDNPKSPKYLRELCFRYLKDILCLVYYDKEYSSFVRIVEAEVAYLKDVVGIKNVVMTEIDSLNK